MKKNTVKVLLLVALGIFSGAANAQNAKQKEWLKKHSDMTSINAHAAQYKAQYEADVAEATRQAAIHNWPLEIRENNGYSLLVKVDADGNPVYLTTFNEGSAITSRTNYLQPGGGLGLDLTGLFMTVGVWDGEYPLPSHVDFAGRYTSNDGPPNPVAMHPTHVLGTIMGSGASSTPARGMAYEAEASVANFADDFSEMAVSSGELILSNHSYGRRNPQASIRGAYIQESQAVDQITFDAPYYQPVFAAGNDGNGTYDRLSDRGCSKNGITVAAIEQPVVNADGTISPTAVTLAGFSNWGPTNDRRVKPDISNKGVHVWSTVDKDPDTGAATDTAHNFLDGTSMATPGVTGALLLVQQHYSNLNGEAFMRSSTVRALVAHTADEVGTDGPDALFGWGVINAKAAAEVITNRGISSIIREDVLTAGTTFAATFNAVAGQPLTATLAWTDPAGELTDGSSPVLVNDLDIRIIDNATNTVTFPWKLAASNSADAVRGDNTVDNIEKVQVANASGSYTVRVSHKGTTLVNPNFGGAVQRYSLIISGTDGVLSTDPVKAVNSAFKVWPNPAHGIVNITINDRVEDTASLIIYDAQGRKVKHAVLTGSENTVNVQDLTSGVYFVNITNGIKSDTKKLVIK